MNPLSWVSTNYHLSRATTNLPFRAAWQMAYWVRLVVVRSTGGDSVQGGEALAPGGWANWLTMLSDTKKKVRARLTAFNLCWSTILPSVVGTMGLTSGSSNLLTSSQLRLLAVHTSTWYCWLAWNLSPRAYEMEETSGHYPIFWTHSFFKEVTSNNGNALVVGAQVLYPAPGNYSVLHAVIPSLHLKKGC